MSESAEGGVVDACVASGMMIEYKLVDEIVGDEYAKDHVLRYAAFHKAIDSEDEELPMTIEEWIEHMTGDHYEEVAVELTNLIKDCPYKGLRFETKGVNAENAKTVPFEFALVNDDRLFDFAAYADQYTFADQLAVANPDNPHSGAFANLGGDAKLVCPKNEGNGDKNRYGHLATFLRKAPTTQIQGTWKLVAETYRQELEARSPHPVWFSTAGGGVRWLHFRLDKRPKYYHYPPFKQEFSKSETICSTCVAS